LTPTSPIGFTIVVPKLVGLEATVLSQGCRVRRHILVLFAALCLAGPAFAQRRTVHGFVTAVHSADSFEIDDYKITCKPNLIFKVQRDQYSPSAPATFNHGDVRVGTELEVIGDYKKSSRELKADFVKIFLFDTVNVDRVALVENPVDLQKTASGAWQGEFVVDGQRVVVSQTTAVSITQNLRDLDAEKPANANAVRTSAKASARAPVPLDSLDNVRLDSFVHYHGIVSSVDGSISATEVQFEDGAVERGIIKIMNTTAPDVKEPNYTAGKSGYLGIAGATGVGALKLGKQYELLPNRAAQDYLSRIGNSLIPEHQKRLLDGDPLKIPFRFYLVSGKRPDANGYPSGAIVVHSGLFAALNNEAELAFILSREMAFVAEDTSWRNVDYHEGGSPALAVANVALPASVFLLSPAGTVLSDAIVHHILDDQYGRSLMNQVDRVALGWTLADGYDIREAPQAWKDLAGKGWGKEAKKDVAAAFGSGADGDLRRSYAQSYVAMYYAQLDYSTLKKDSDDFHRVAQQISHSRH
jgi:hypothetical protein